MSPKKIRLLIVSLIVILGAAGCKCNNAAVEAFELILDSPVGGEVVTSLTPTFDWHGSDTCDPDNYRIHIEEVAGSDHASMVVPYTDVPYTLTGDSLLPGRAYSWGGMAENEWSLENPGAHGPYSEPEFFFTGPVCSGEALIDPDLIDPNAAEWLSKEHIFKWTYTGGCLPVSYEVQFARDAGFTDIYLTTSTTEPYVQELLMAFPDCSTLFWRVRASDGTSFGPWSAGRDFHYILSSGCYQWHYESDDFAWISTLVIRDACDQTGYIAAWTEAPLHTGCMVDGMIIVGDGTTYSGYLNDVVIDLGSGPCPSTGLDQKIGDPVAKFGVLTPGTYCVTVSRNQTADNNGPQSMMDGVWTDPRSNQILVQETVDFGPGNHDYSKRFAWDETDRTFLTYPLVDYTFDCKIGPEKVCPTSDFARAGETIPILGRDSRSEWMLTQLNGTPCYVQIPGSLIDGYLGEFDPEGPRVADLEIFPQPDPCLRPSSGSEMTSCSDHGDPTTCRLDSRCKWIDINVRIPFCTTK